MSAKNELSFTILNLCGNGPKEMLESLEKNVAKLTMHNFHLSFNETALNKCLLHNYTNIYTNAFRGNQNRSEIPPIADSQEYI